MNELKHPLFNNSFVGIRFEIGGHENVYLRDERLKEYTANPAYISAAFDSAKAIYANLPHKPNLLTMYRYTDEEDVQKIVQMICKAANLPLPHEQIEKSFQLDEQDETVSQLLLYWDLEKISFTPDKLLKGIIMTDIGGYTGFGSVYFADTYNSIIFHLYDDRGADLVSADKEVLRPICEKFNSWISDNDRAKINAIFE